MRRSWLLTVGVLAAGWLAVLAPSAWAGFGFPSERRDGGLDHKPGRYTRYTGRLASL